MKCFYKTNKNTKQLSKNLLLLKTLSDENRLKIICFLKTGEKCVCEIVDFLELPQNLVSHHLKILRDQNIVSTKKQGLKIIYSLNTAWLPTIIKFFNSLNPRYVD